MDISLFRSPTVLVPIAASALWYALHMHPPSPVVDAGFNINNVVTEAFKATSRSWEYGTLAEALLELRNPELTVFAQNPFPAGRLPAVVNGANVTALEYVRPLIWTNDTDLLIGGEGRLMEQAMVGMLAIMRISRPQCQIQGRSILTDIF